jgi:hypothetical protein
LHDVSLSYEFLILFLLVSNKIITVVDAPSLGVANLTFDVPLENHLQELNTLVCLTSHVTLLPDRFDTICWRWNVSGRFIVYSFYQWLIDCIMIIN